MHPPPRCCRIRRRSEEIWSFSDVEYIVRGPPYESIVSFSHNHGEDALSIEIIQICSIHVQPLTAQD